ncbi:hypothetical protein THAOC_34520 [Thalassiosira oceanica]|uniref:Uncharacterized protein n=1 Tax=Thalassiosira oceanica TaxID=159749 RepID=K0R4U2_THAOC|nr:hypothetical protein THAOC_34520 [Thalassiosira oceanica]|eukprot:EJK46794.1 hypothetical protein THAOC_34520 [Thalassiosira oceanica]
MRNMALDCPPTAAGLREIFSGGTSQIPRNLQIGSSGQCLSIGLAAGAQNVKHPRGDHGAAGNLSCVSRGQIDEVTGDVSATGHAHSAERKRFESKQDDVNTKPIPEPMANALSSCGPRERERERERDQASAKIH